MFHFFKTKDVEVGYLPTDIHSHILPGIDDGPSSLEESLQILRRLRDAGITKWVTTPHIFFDYYKNSPLIIKKKLSELKNFLYQAGEAFEISCAAEYYLDEYLMKMLNEGHELLSFGNNYLLFETNMLAETLNMNEFIFKLNLKGFKPVMAHPERYEYLAGKLDKIADLRNRGVLMQLNSLSLIGHYSRPIQKMAIELVQNNMVDFIGTDCHNIRHAELIREVSKNKYFKKLLGQPLLNNQI